MVSVKGIAKIFVVILLMIGLMATGYSAMNGLDSDSERGYFLIGITCLGVCGVLAGVSTKLPS